MPRTDNRPGAAGPGPIRSQALAGGGVSASSNLPDLTDNRAVRDRGNRRAPRRLLHHVDLDGQLARRGPGHRMFDLGRW